MKINIVKNVGQIASLKGKCKYLLHVYDEESVGDLYAKIGIRPIFWYIHDKIKYGHLKIEESE